MKRTISQLRKQHNSLVDLIQNRDDYAYNRSEKWQESEVGENYQYQTDEIQGLSDDLENIIDLLEEVL